ncbi:MAG TPA: L-threonate dehydrogenase [Acetobacteraceae bacterium]|jgi:3-hydroxyisobutyrate dehydrogenase|nr:L-threonate dehydrogenase [Acetobacteraceae bacterium]
MKVGVIGLGSMGVGAARRLLEKGHEVHGCEPRDDVRTAFAADGGHPVARPDELPPDLAAIIVFVVNATQAEDVLFGPHAVPIGLNAVAICCTTLAPDAAVRLEARLAERQVPMLDAPVSGGTRGAREGTMTVMASGSELAFARAEPVLADMAGKVWRLGERAGIGSTVKMVNQLLAGVHIATAAEALALGIRAGADPKTLYDVISSSAGSSWMWQNRVPHILAGDDTPHSAVNIFVKDLGIVLDQARALTFPLPLAAAAHQLFLAAAAAGHGGRDDAFVIRVWEALNAIRLPEPTSSP